MAAADLDGKRAFLVFHGAAFRSTAWLNGKELGTSVQCAVPFEYDATAAIRPGENELLVALTGREGIVDIANRCYVTPCNGMMAGIWGSVALELRPAVYLDDVFVRTSVKNRRIELDLAVKNAGPAAQTVRPACVIVDQEGNPHCSIAGPPLTVPAGQTGHATLAADWIAPRLWSPETPALYFARVSLLKGDAAVDRTTTRFGFREFEIRGRDFFLNGVRTTLLRNSMLTALGAPFENGFRAVRRDAGRPYNCVRLHLGQCNTDLLDACDLREGHLGAITQTVPPTSRHGASAAASEGAVSSRAAGSRAEEQDPQDEDARGDGHQYQRRGAAGRARGRRVLDLQVDLVEPRLRDAVGTEDLEDGGLVLLSRDQHGPIGESGRDHVAGHGDALDLPGFGQPGDLGDVDGLWLLIRGHTGFHEVPHDQAGDERHRKDAHTHQQDDEPSILQQFPDVHGDAPISLGIGKVANAIGRCRSLPEPGEAPWRVVPRRKEVRSRFPRASVRLNYTP